MKAYQVWSAVYYEASGGNGDFVCSRDTLAEATAAAQHEVDNPQGPSTYVWITLFDSVADRFELVADTFRQSEWVYRVDAAYLSDCAICNEDIPVGVPRLERGTKPYAMCPRCIELLDYGFMVEEASNG